MIAVDRSAQGLEVLPRRIFLEGDREPTLDTDGFVLPIGEVLTSQLVLQQAAVLAVAPPWTGKTTVAKGLVAAQKVHAYSLLTCFVERERGFSVVPPWWEPWISGDASALWIVDAVDEDARKDRQCHTILQLIRALPGGALSRLHLISFCRINEVPDWFEKGLAEIFGLLSPDRPLGLRRLRLAGLDRENARILIGESRFNRACHLIRKNDLRILASYPIALEYIADKTEDESLTKEEVWEGVLKDLLRERNELLQPSFKFEIEDRFAVAQKLAAQMTFCGIMEINPESGLEGMFPSTIIGYSELRSAARETWKTTVFERSDRGYRFCKDQLRQWLAAFALRGMSLLQVRPLLTLESGELDSSHEGIIGFLAQITHYPDVKDWIVTAHGGLPSSDGGVWSLQEASHALDKLQELARSSPRGLSLWRQEGLQSFGKVAGMGAEIARRLDGPLQPSEQQLLIEIAYASEMPEPIEPAARLLQNSTQDERVRTEAAVFVAKFGTAQKIKLLLPWVESLGPPTESRDNVLPHLVAAFYSNGLWSFETASKFALARSEMGDNWLQYQLAENLSVEHARWLLGEEVLQTLDVFAQPLVEKAIEKVLEKEGPSEDDAGLLIPLVLQGEVLERKRSNFDTNRIPRFLQKSSSARRTLFTEGLTLDPECKGEDAWRWNILSGEDAAWLLELIQERTIQPARLWQTLYFVAYHSGASQPVRRRIREEIRAKNEVLLKRLDQEQKQLKDSERKWRERSSKREAKSYELDSLVRETLESQELELCNKMLNLSWYCFEQPGYRPSNVSGKWEDLSADIRARVLVVCQQALVQCPPTIIPEGPTFSSKTSWEAKCFDRLVQEDMAFLLTTSMVHKWLPSLLRDWVTGSGYEPTLRKCFEVDRQEAEGVFIEATLRDVRTGRGSIYIVQQLTPDLWSESLSARLEQEIILAEKVSSDTRIDLLGRIGRALPLRARTIALTWADGGRA